MPHIFKGMPLCRVQGRDHFVVRRKREEEGKEFHPHSNTVCSLLLHYIYLTNCCGIHKRFTDHKPFSSNTLVHFLLHGNFSRLKLYYFIFTYLLIWFKSFN